MKEDGAIDTYLGIAGSYIMAKTEEMGDSVESRWKSHWQVIHSIDLLLWEHKYSLVHSGFES